MYAGMYSALKRCNVLANESRLVRRVFVGIRRHVYSRYHGEQAVLVKYKEGFLRYDGVGGKPPSAVA